MGQLDERSYSSSTSTSTSSPTSADLSATTTTPSTSSSTPTPTTATQTPPSTPTPTATEAPSPGTNAGLVAGVAVGCLIAGALLGLILAFFFYRRRARSYSRYNPPVSAESKPFHQSPPPAAVQDRFQLRQFLLDSSPDKEIASELHSLGGLIQQHVENNYHLRPAHVDPRALAVFLTQLGIRDRGSLTPETIAALALEPGTRQVALQHVISQVIFTSVDVSSRSHLSMLPAPIAAFLQSIPPKENGGNNAEVSAYALNEWRVLSAFLLHPAPSARTPLPASNSAVAHQAAAFASALDTFLGHFVVGDEASRLGQRSHLQAVIAECTKLGYVLLSQPSEWRFVHAPARQGGSHAAVVCAGLVKVTHKDGTPYGTPQEVVAPTAVQL
ncbi:hypothetical protein GE09DRAFT_1291073 [Coniochaeta sp. 2T2.1]|nr:hypothetical protein GE09DRAFT_1291073 [Coniochaeta sp. 2T2.1]